MTMRHALSVSLLVLAATACKQAALVEQPTLHEVMAGKIDPVADVIWEESSKSYGDDGNAKVGVLDAAQWAAIAKAGRDLHDGAMVIADNPGIKVVPPGVKILDEGTVPEAITGTQVEAYVDADREGLAKHARELSKIALEIEAAAKARDAVRTVKLSEDLDEVCESCHQRFWYPDQKALIDYKKQRVHAGRETTSAAP